METKIHKSELASRYNKIYGNVSLDVVVNLETNGVSYQVQILKIFEPITKKADEQSLFIYSNFQMAHNLYTTLVNS